MVRKTCVENRLCLYIYSFFLFYCYSVTYNIKALINNMLYGCSSYLYLHLTVTFCHHMQVGVDNSRTQDARLLKLYGIAMGHKWHGYEIKLE